MTSRRILGWTVVLAAAAIGLWATCSRATPLPVRRVMTYDHRSGDPNVQIERTRNSERHIEGDLRDANTQVLDKPLEVALAATGRSNARTAAALFAPRDYVMPKDAVFVFSLDWEIPGGPRVHVEHEVPALAALTSWTPFEAGPGSPLKERSVLRLLARAKSPVPPGLRVGWSVPEVQGYFGAPLPGPKRAESAPNILFLSVDTLRADHLRCYGYERDTSPHVDALAQQGVLFEDAISTAPWTLPSYGSLFTGLTPGRHGAGAKHGLLVNWDSDRPCDLRGLAGRTQPLKKDVRTLAEILTEAGWRTAAFTNNPFLLPSCELDRGFQRYVSYEYNAKAGVDVASEWIATQQDRPWFCFLHLMDPHMPYVPPEPWDAKFSGSPLKDHPGWPPALDQLRSVALAANTPEAAATRQLLKDYYDAEIAFTDDQIGRLLAELQSSGALANTIVVFHSDHGEEFWDHGAFEHGHSLHRELLHVPVILRWDGHLPAGTRVKERMRSMDLFPTLLELADVAVPTGLDAQSLVSMIGKGDHTPRDVTSEFILWGPREMKSRIQGRWKLIAAGAKDDELYDLDDDVGEEHDLSKTHGDEARRLRDVLRAHNAETLRELPPPVRIELNQGEIQRLNETGYGGSVEEDDAAGPRNSAPSSGDSAPPPK